MTQIQINFLKAIYEEPKTAEQLCQELNITVSVTNDPIGAYYNELNRQIGYPSEQECEFEDMFELIENSYGVPNKDTYYIKERGEDFIKNLHKN